MSPIRKLQVLAALRGEADETTWLARLSALAVEATGMDAAGITVRSADRLTGSVAGTDALVRRLEAIQFEVGEGPCVDAITSGRPVVAADLCAAADRWPAFAPMATAAGAAAVGSFPLTVDDVLVGALVLHRTSPGGLTDEQQADARVIAGVAATAVLVLQAGAEPGEVASMLAPNDLDVVHQAAGMASIQLGLPIPAALTRLRGLAFLDDRPLAEVARDVVERRIRLADPDERDHRGRSEPGDSG